MNDDIFLADQVTATDFYSPGTMLPLSREAWFFYLPMAYLVFGPVFRMQSDLLTDPNRPRVGEWIHLQHSNDLLSKPILLPYIRTICGERPFLMLTESSVANS